MSWTMQTVYLTCAAAGGAVLLIQTIMLLFGGGDHDVGAADADHPEIGHADSGEHHGHDAAFNLLSVRSVAAFLTFFGLAGWGGTNAGWGTFPTIAVSVGAGAAMLVAVAWLFSLQRSLYSQGNLEPARAVGLTARVYLKGPGAGAGKGKITVSVQGRTHEFAASTPGAEIPTGAEVRIVRQITQDTFEVEAL